jgi:Protein of unknown function (DUF3667)
MSGEFDAAGTAIEGALIGAAVDKGELLDANGDTTETACLNCGAQLTGPYCAACGQKAHVHRTLSAIGHDVLHSVFHFDGKLWRTLPMLLFKPGELTRRFIHGERAKFVSPMGLFLFAIFMMFAVFSFTGDGSTANVPAGWQKGLAEEAKTLDAEIPKVEAKLRATPATSPEAKVLREKLQDMKSERNGIGFATEGKAVFVEEDAQVDVAPGVKLSAWKSDTGIAWLDHKLNNGGEKMISNPGLALYKLQSNGYKFAWLLVPLSLPFVWLVTLGVRGHRFYDHAVFTTYSISFMCILFIIASLAGWAGVNDGWLAIAFTIIPLAHIYEQLRHAYGLTRLGTLLRMVPLLLSTVFVVTIFFLILLMLGIMG